MAESNFDNRTLFHGDNLGFLRGINSESIDLVATDPPFNKGKDFHATPDSLAAGASFHDRWSWERDIEGEWEDAIKDDWPAVQQVIESANAAWGRDMGAFLCYMGVRLLEIHRVLKPTGSLYLHCDDTASAYLTMLLDAIFGQKNRRNVITWERMRGSKGKTSNWGRSADSLLYYTKSERFTWNTQYGDLSPSGLGNYRRDDGDGKGPYMLADLGDPHDGYRYELDLGEKAPKRGYRMPEATARQMLADGILWVEPGRVPASSAICRIRSEPRWGMSGTTTRSRASAGRRIRRTRAFRRKSRSRSTGGSSNRRQTRVKSCSIRFAAARRR